MIMDIKYRRELYKLLPKDFHSCECGIAEGLFSADILEMGSAKHYLIDSWEKLNQTGDGGFPQEWHDDNYYATVARMVKYGERAVILKGMTDHMAHQIPDNSLDLVYLDADHSFSGVHRDLRSYWQKLKSGGVLAGHDFLNEAYGVRPAVLEFADIHKLTVNIIPEDKEVDAGFYIIKP